MAGQHSLFGGEGPEIDPSGHSLVGADLVVIPSAIGPALADRAMEVLRREIEWQQDHILMMGKQIPLPRLTAWFGDQGCDYTYSGIAMSTAPWTPLLSEFRRRVDELAGVRFNSVLCNLYRSGDDGLAWHSDNEPELGSRPTIASVSLGATRRFLVRRRDDHRIKTEILLSHRDVLVMKGLTQDLCEHSVPKTKKHVGPRINLTFRKIDG